MAQIHQLLPNRASRKPWESPVSIIVRKPSLTGRLIPWCCYCDDNLCVVKHLAYIVARRSPPAYMTLTAVNKSAIPHATDGILMFPEVESA